MAHSPCFELAMLCVEQILIRPAKHVSCMLSSNIQHADRVPVSYPEFVIIIAPTIILLV